MSELETANFKKHCCAEVYPNLLLGSINSLHSIQQLGITHVLSVYNAPLKFPVDEDVAHLHIHIADIGTSNLLMILAHCFDFIETGLASPNGRVLVHCFAGMSRSVSVVLAFLMKKRNQPFRKTYTDLDEIYPHAGPNSGFMIQLQLFEHVNYDIEKAIESLKSHKEEFNTSEVRIERNEKAALTTSKTNDIKDDSKETRFVFRCRECLHELGTDRDVINSEQVDLLGTSGSLFLKESSTLINDLAKGTVNGKLYCPNCSEKLGSFNWAGIKDSTNWHVPGFQIHISRIDLISDVLDDKIKIHHPKFTNLTNGHHLFEYVVFDCDGVLVNTEVASCESLYLCIKDVTGFKIPRKFPEDYYEVFGMDVLNCLKHFKQKYNTDWDCEGILDQALESKETHYQALTAKEILPFDGVVPLLEKLQERRKYIGVASSGHPVKLNRNLKMSGLVRYFQDFTIVSAVEVDKGKPAPDVYLEAFRRLKVNDPSKVLVIEDSTNGLKAAKGAGAFCVGITNSLPRPLLEEHSDLVVEHISEIEPLIMK